MKLQKTISLLFILISSTAFAQIESDSSYVLIGTVVNGENNNLLSGANIITSYNFGTKSNELGEFSIHTQKNDTITISFVGYKTLKYVAPDKKPGKYLVKFKMYRDSISLREVEVFPYPTYEEFKAAFIEHDKQDEQIKIEGIKTYVDRDVSYKAPSAFSPASFIYDKLFDKSAKTRRKLNRRSDKVNNSAIIKEE